MLKRLLFIIAFFNALFVESAEPPRKPNVFVLNIDALESNKAKIKSKDAAVMSAYKMLLKDADKSMQFGPVSVMEKKNDPPSGDKHDYMSLAPYFWPNPDTKDGLPYIRKDGQTNPEVKDYKDKEYMPALCGHVQTLALAYYFSEDNSYAEHAAKLLRVWFLDPATRMNPNLNYGQAIKGQNEGRGAGLIDSRHFVKLIDAIGLLADSKSWTKENQQGMQNWFADYLQWMETSKNGKDEMNAKNNHGAWYDAQRLSMALFTENKEAAKSIVKNAADRLDKQMEPDGSFPKEMERTISLHYTVFAMEAFFNIANMAEKVGIDFWKMTTASGKSLKKGFDVLLPYISNEKEWTGQQIKPYDFEEGYVLMMDASEKFNCKKCVRYVRSLAADKAERLRINLLY